MWYKVICFILWLLPRLHVGLQSTQKRLLLTDPDTQTLIHQLHVKIQDLESAVSTLKLNVHDSPIVGFYAQLSHRLENMADNSRVVFDRVVANDGGAYDPVSGIFLCPEDGLYSFTWTTHTYPDKIFHTILTVNGQTMGYNHNNLVGIKEAVSSTSNVVLHLKRETRVWIRTDGHWGQLAMPTLTTFSGFKIHD